MKKAYLITLALLLPFQAIAIEKDSVYTWGEWSKGLQPAAGPVAQVTPPPAKTPDVNFRANENSAFLREASIQDRFPTPSIAAPSGGSISGQTNVVVISPTTPISTTGPSTGGF